MPFPVLPCAEFSLDLLFPRTKQKQVQRLGGLAQPYSNMRRDAPTRGSFTGGLLRTLPACSLVTAKSPRSWYIVAMPTNLHRYYGAGHCHLITISL